MPDGAALDPEQRALLAGAVDTLLPAGDDHPAGWAGGVGAYVDDEWHGLLRWAHEPVAVALDQLAAGATVDDLEPESLAALRRVTHEGFYGRPGPGWQAVGFEPRPPGHRPGRARAVADPPPRRAGR